jgi:hypothetical protein
MRLRTTLAPATLALMLLLTACGGGGGDGVATLDGSKASGGTTSTTLSKAQLEDAMNDWTSCMRAEGVDLPDFQVDSKGNSRIGVAVAPADGGTDGEAPKRPDRDAFEAARKKCGEPPQQGGEISEADRKEMQDNALAFAQCMRDEGLTDFPDPDFSKMGPGAGPSVRIDDNSSSSASSDGGDKGPFGGIDPSTPEFQAAQKVCSAKVPGGPVIRSGGPGTGSVSVEAK